MRRSISLPQATGLGFVLLLTSAAVFLMGCAGDGETDTPEVRAVVTMSLLEDFVRQVGGERVQVEALLPPGADPHTYEPVPRDVALITDADIVFSNGLHLEEATLDLIEANLPGGVPLVELAGVAAEEGAVLIDGGEGGDEEANNPHLWLDPEIAKQYVTTIQEELSIVDPAGAESYADNYRSYSDEIDSLSRYLSETTGVVPDEYRVLVTTHDAFPYLARAIGFQVGAVVTVSPGQEPSPQVIAQISGVIAGTGVPAVFREPQLGPETDVLEQAASDAGVEVCVLYSGTFGGEVETYADLVRHNADEIARCLGE